MLDPTHINEASRSIIGIVHLSYQSCTFGGSLSMKLTTFLASLALTIALTLGFNSTALAKHGTYWGNPHYSQHAFKPHMPKLAQRHHFKTHQPHRHWHKWGHKSKWGHKGYTHYKYSKRYRHHSNPYRFHYQGSRHHHRM